jgi:hypothetical protein
MADEHEEQHEHARKDYPGAREDEELREELDDALESAHHPGPGPHEPGGGAPSGASPDDEGADDEAG